MSECYCDYDAPTCISVKTPRARMSYKCGECGGAIEPGDTYEAARGLWDGAWSYFKTCRHCVEIREDLSEMDCFCWSYGGLWEDIAEHFIDAEFLPGVEFYFLRQIAKHPCRKLTAPQ